MTLWRGWPCGRTWLPWRPRTETCSRSCNRCTRKRRRESKYVAVASGAAEPDQRRGDRDWRSAVLDSGGGAHAHRHLPEFESSGDLCGATVWGNVAGADGGIPRLLLRVSLTVHQRD